VAQEESVEAQASQDAQKDTLAAKKITSERKVNENQSYLPWHCRVWIQ
jgi:hypothetical protein